MKDNNILTGYGDIQLPKDVQQILQDRVFLQNPETNLAEFIYPDERLRKGAIV